MNNNEKSLNIKWQRLIVNKKTCPRCSSTEEVLDKAMNKLKQSLEILGIKVTLEKKELLISEFKKDSLQSNKIWINDLPLESYIGGITGKSLCCDVCGPSECRTIEVEGQIYETISYEMLMQAGLLAASQLFITKKNIS